MKSLLFLGILFASCAQGQRLSSTARTEVNTIVATAVKKVADENIVQSRDIAALKTQPVYKAKMLVNGAMLDRDSLIAGYVTNIDYMWKMYLIEKQRSDSLVTVLKNLPALSPLSFVLDKATNTYIIKK